MSSALLSRIPQKHKRQIKSALRHWQLRWIRAFRSFGPSDLVESLRTLGVHGGDTILLHSSFEATSGFVGTMAEVTDSFLQAIGEDGNLVMVSLPYRGSTRAYLEELEVFDVRRAPSRMGLISESFRRRPGVLRSLHPTHPVLAWGPRATWIVAAHEECPYACGPGSPFEKILELDGKVAFYDAGIGTMTFVHWLEHRIQNSLGFPLYHTPPYQVRVLDGEGVGHVVTAHAFSNEVMRRRRFPALEKELRRAGVIARQRIGNTFVQVARMADIVRCVDEMIADGRYFHEI